MEGVEDRHQVVAVARVGVGRGDLEAHTVGDAGLGGRLAGPLDRGGVVVVADEGRPREGLGEQDRGGAVAAADVGHPRPGGQLVADAVEVRDPGVDQVGRVPGPEEALGALPQVGVVLAPADPAAGPERLGDPRLVLGGGGGHLEGAGHEGGAGLVGERERLLLGEQVAVAGRVVRDVAAGRLAGQPLGDVALAGGGAGGQLRRGGRAGRGQRLVEAELVAGDHGGRVERGPQVGDEAAKELVQLGLVDGRCADLLGRWAVDGAIVAPGLAPWLRSWPSGAAIAHNPCMDGRADLRLRVLGVLAVAVDGREAPAHELASRKGRALRKLLLARRGAVVPADVLVEALWEGRPPADPDANLATLVSRLRAVLGPDAIAGDRQGWRFVAGTRAEVDLDEAERLAAEAEARLGGQPALALAAAERALALLGRGPFLADEPDADWAVPARREAERLTARARRLAAAAALAVGDPARALVHATAGTAADPLDEPAWRAVMRAHAAT